MDTAFKLQSFFQTLGEANRLKIIRVIGDGESSVSEIVRSTKLSQPLVSHHLKVMREIQILETHRKGPFVYYKLKDKRLLDALGLFSEIVSSMSGIKIKRPMFFCPPWWHEFFDLK